MKTTQEYYVTWNELKNRRGTNFRDPKTGKFAKKDDLERRVNQLEADVHWLQTRVDELITKKEEKTVIDWEMLSRDIESAYFETSGTPFSWAKNHTKAYFMVFKKHGLIREGVEI